MENIKRELTEKVITHWREMIEWVEKQIPNESISITKMKESINQTWNGNYCDFCKKFNNWDIMDDKEPCEDCPLFNKYGRCSENNKDRNLWFNVYKSRTWGEWLVNSRLFLKQLESLRG